MSAQSELREHLNGNGRPAGPTADDLRTQLTERLGLGDVGVEVASATIFGKGPRASVDLRLSDGSTITFERFGDIGMGPRLATYLATTTGVARTFKAPEAIAIAALIQRVADHQTEASSDEAAREWGAEFLRVAPSQLVALDDQADRWRAFSALTYSPAQKAGEDRSAQALAATSLVLVERDGGQRLVRSGWFQSYVKREVGGLYSPQELVVQMLRVGWRRPNSQGRIKATCPAGGPPPLAWSFYIVAADWESQVTAGYSPDACVRAHARGSVDTPAVTRNPASPDEPTSPNDNGRPT